MNNKDKELFISLLRDINRPQTEELIARLESLGFFVAPASCKSNGHLPFKGGLLRHSLNTFQIAHSIAQILRHPLITEESIIVSSLLHDVCKANRYTSLDDGTYQRNNDSMLPHSEMSLLTIMKVGYPLLDAEIAAIRWHMAPFRLNQQCEDEKLAYEWAVRKYPLVTLIGCSDTISAKIVECNML